MELVSICRTCLARETHKNISDLKTQPGDNCSDILLFCLNIKVEDDSKISTNLCLKCFKKVMAFYKFKLLALKNDAYLKTVESEDSVKNEIYLQDDDIKIENNLNDHQESSCGSDIGDSLLSIKIEPQAKEDEADGQSDNELLSVIKKIKYEFVADPIEETKENSPAKKPKRKRGRPPNPEGRRKKPAAISQICEECGKTVKNLKEHSLQHLPAATRKMYSCKSCDKKFASYGARSKHNKRKHLGLKKTCPICNKMVSDVWAHRRVSHEPASLRHACASCGRRFISPSALRAHASMHTRAMPYACDACGKRFRVKLLMQQHRRRVHENEKSHMCQFCSKSFFKKYHLQVHIRSHTKEKPYKCPECNKCFSTTTILNNHSLAVHSGVKRHACTLCSMTFARPGYLRVHMISHTKEKKHPCKYCGIRFGRSDHRKRHEFTAHERHLITNLDPKDLGSTIEAQVKRTRLPKETAIVEPSHDVTSVSYYDTTDRGDCVEYEKADDQFHVKTDSPFRGGRKPDEFSG